MQAQVIESIAEFVNYEQNTHREDVVRSVAAAILLLRDHQQHKEPYDGKELIVSAIVKHREKMAELLGFVPLPNEEDIAKFMQQLVWLYNIPRNELDLVIVYDPKEGCDKKLSISVADTLMYLIPALSEHSRFVRSTYLDRLIQFYLLTVKLSGSKICSGGIRNQYIEMLHLDYKRTENTLETVFIFTAWEASLAFLCKMFYDKKFENLKDKQFQYRVLCQWLSPSDDENDLDFDTFLGDGSDLREYLLSFLEHSGMNLAKDNKIQKRVEGYVTKRNELHCPSPELLSTSIDCVASCLSGDYKQTLGIFAHSVEIDFNQCQTLEDIERYQLAKRLRLGVIQNKAYIYANLLPMGAEEANLRDLAREILIEIRENSEAICVDQIQNYDTRISDAIKHSRKGDDDFLSNAFALVMATPDKKKKFRILTRLFESFRAKKLAILDDAQFQRWHSDQHVSIEHQYGVKDMTNNGITIQDNQTNTVTMTPGSINRIIFQALEMSPDQWSPTFTHIMKTVVLPLISSANDNDHAHQSVIDGSYPPILVAQLSWLSKLARHLKIHGIKCHNYFSQMHLHILTNLMFVYTANNLLLEEFFKEFDPNITTETIDLRKPFVNLLQHLSINDQLKWLEKCIGIRFIPVFLWLPDEKKLSFLLEHLDEIEDSIIPVVLKSLNAQDRLVFAREIRKEIKNVARLVWVLKKLNSLDRLAFARENQDKIENIKGLVMVLECLNQQHRFAFARENQDKIQDSADLVKVLAILNDSEQLAFARENQDKIENIKGLVMVLECLNQQHRFAFARENQEKIQTPQDVVRVLNNLHVSERLEFANLFKSKFNQLLYKVLRNSLNRTDYLALKEARSDQIQDYITQLNEQLEFPKKWAACFFTKPISSNIPYIKQISKSGLNLDRLKIVLDQNENIKEPLLNLLAYTTKLASESEPSFLWNRYIIRLDKIQELISFFNGLGETKDITKYINNALLNEKLTLNRTTGFFKIYGRIVGKKNTAGDKSHHHWIHSTTEELLYEIKIATENRDFIEDNSLSLEDESASNSESTNSDLSI